MARSDRARRRAAHHDGEEGSERWLLTYADMITLLMALFMVLFSISAVNVSKFHTLQQALHAAFSGSVLPGGRSIAQPGSAANSSHAPTAHDIESIVPTTSIKSDVLQTPSNGKGQGAHGASASDQAAAQHEQEEFQRLKRQLEAYAARHGFARDVHVRIERRGLVIRVLTDKLLFPSGGATLRPGGLPLVDEIADLVNLDSVHPVGVEGNTDDLPIHNSVFPSNWELSTARASTVVRYLIDRSVNPQRLSAAGYADLHPIATNANEQGRALNRRVEIVLQRIH